MNQNAFDNVSPLRHKVLDALAKYRYMTVKQFVLAGISPSPQYLRRGVLAPLHTRVRGKLIEFVEMGFEAGKGCKPRVYFLTEHGAKAIAEYERCEETAIPYPKGGMQYARDFYHREAYIDYLIIFHRWLEHVGGRTLGERHYFDSQGSNRKGTQSHAMTRVALSDGFIVPDGLVEFEAGGKRRVAAVEIHRHTDPKRCAEQLEKHMAAVKEQAVTGLFGGDGASAVLSVATERGMSERIRARMRETRDFLPHFLPIFRFACMEDIRADYGTAWVYADGRPAPLA